MQWLAAVFGVMWLAAATPVLADSWMPPERNTYESADKATRLTVIPRELEGSLPYFEDKLDDKEPAGQRAGGEPRARGVLERRVGGKWVTLWRAPLANEVAPVSALVTNGGDYVATFDNWHSVGFGENVIVIYRADGTIVRSMALKDILPEDYIRALPTSVSSTWWSGEHELSRDQRSLILKVAVPGEMAHEPRGYVDVLVDLATGAVTPASGPAWAAAQVVAAPRAARSRSAEAKWRAEALAPLQAPAGPAQRDWTRYLHQAKARLAPPARQMMLGQEEVLPPASSPTFAERAAAIRGMLTQWNERDDFAFASPAAPEALAQLLIESARAGKPGRLAGSRLFVALPAAAAEPVRAALASTGATIILFDPAVPLSQRVERLRELGVPPDKAAEEAALAAADAARWDAEATALEAKVPPGSIAQPETAGDTVETEEMAEMIEAVADQASDRCRTESERVKRVCASQLAGSFCTSNAVPERLVLALAMFPLRAIIGRLPTGRFRARIL